MLLSRNHHKKGASGDLMQRLLTFAILLMSTLSLHAQGQQPDVTQLKADARNLVGIIGNDKAKTQTYCQISELSEQLDQADREKNRKKAMDLSQKIGLLESKLGPDFFAVLHALLDIDPESPDGQELASIIGSLDNSCD